jgi:hypothetical protein
MLVSRYNYVNFGAGNDLDVARQVTDYSQVDIRVSRYKFVNLGAGNDLDV